MLPTIFLSFAIAILVIIAFMWTYLYGFGEDPIEDRGFLEEWIKPIISGLALVSVAIILSNVSLSMDWAGLNLDLNLTGALLPIGIMAFLIAKRKLDLMDLGLVASAAGILALIFVTYDRGSIVIDFVHWQLIVVVVSILTIILVEKRHKSGPLGLAFSSGFTSMLVGGDILGIFRMQLGNVHHYIGGLGVLDFMFLVAVESVACVWIIMIVINHGKRIEQTSVA
jgi:uncharacterized membrane protein